MYAVVEAACLVRSMGATIEPQQSNLEFWLLGGVGVLACFWFSPRRRWIFGFSRANRVRTRGRKHVPAFDSPYIRVIITVYKALYIYIIITV